MYARFLFAWPEEPPYRPLTNEVAEIEPKIVNALVRIIDLKCGDGDNFAPRDLALSLEAIEAFERYRKFQHSSKDGLDGREREWWAKSPAHVLRLAGTLSYLSWAMEGSPEPEQTQPEPEKIEAEFVEAAIRLVRDYFWPHTRAALRQVELIERHANNRRVLRWIKAHGKHEVSREEIRRGALSQTLDADQTQTLLNGLERAGWVCPLSPKRQGPGRPPNRWAVNSKLLIDAEIAEIAESHVD